MSDNPDRWAVPAVTPIEHPGALTLYAAASGLEKALADVDAERLVGIYAEAIIDVWNPWAISLVNLPFLAWAMGVGLWEEGWSEATKREWVARQWEFKALRGTENGIAMALDFVGRGFTTNSYKLLQAVTPPQGFYASPSLTKEQWDAWIRLMPQLRVKFASYVGDADDEFFAEHKEHDLIEGQTGVGGDGFCNCHFVGHDDGWELYGRKAVIRYADGSETDLKIVEWIDTTVSKPATLIGRASTVETAASESGFWAEPEDESLIAGTVGSGGYGFVGEDCFVGFDLKEPTIYSYRIDTSYDHVTSILHLDYLTPSLDPIDVRYERDSDVGTDDLFFFADADFCADPNDHSFVGDGSEAAEMLADRIYLYDPAVAAPMMRGISFAGIDRVGMPAYHADLLVDLGTKEEAPSFFDDDGFAAEAFAGVEDGSHIDRACRAICAAKAFRDKISVSFESTSPLVAHDLATSDEQTSFGEQRRTIL